MTIRKLNWRPAFKGHDIKTAYKVEDTSKPLPAKVDLRPLCPPIVDQGGVGSCSANATACLVDFLQLRAERAKIQAQEVYDPSKFESSSRFFIYYNERLLEGDVNDDGGVTTLASACKALATYGTCPEWMWPYIEDQFATKPTDAAYSFAANHEIPGPGLMLNSEYDRKHCLAGGFPFMMGIPVYPSFQGDAAAATGVIPMPGPDESPEGGHAITVVGYDDDMELGGVKGAWICRNSWGTDWGDQGYFYLHYAYEREYADDQLTLRP